MSDSSLVLQECSVEEVARIRAFRALSSTEQIAAASLQRKKTAAEDSLRQFVEQGWDVLEPGTKFIPAMHVDAVCEHLQAMIEERLKDLIINIPPGFA